MKTSSVYLKLLLAIFVTTAPTLGCFEIDAEEANEVQAGAGPGAEPGLAARGNLIAVAREAGGFDTLLFAVEEAGLTWASPRKLDAAGD